jgi:hypothetical protein
MKRQFSVIAFILTLNGTLFPASREAAAELVVFNGSLQGNVTITPIDAVFVSLLIEGSGSATQLGQFTFKIPHTVNFPAATGSGQYLFTTAIGDTLRADFTGSATPTIANPNNFNIVETATITDGTGRFAGATGSFTAERFFDAASLTTTGSFTGMISRPVPEPTSASLFGLAAIALISCHRRARTAAIHVELN